MFGIKRAVTKQQKRRDMFITRWNAASTPDEKLRMSTDYLRTACHGMSPEEKARVAWDLLQFAARADGVEVVAEPDSSHAR